MRLYLDNQLVTYLTMIESLRARGDLLGTLDALVALLARDDVEILLSEESLAEIRRLSPGPKRSRLEETYRKLKESQSVIRNSKVTWNDPIATWNSPDVMWSHPYTDDDLNRVKVFFAQRGNRNEFDARYIANAMLPENEIAAFVTADRRSIWRHRAEIKEQFGVNVYTPEEAASIL